MGERRTFYESILLVDILSGYGICCDTSMSMACDLELDTVEVFETGSLTLYRDHPFKELRKQSQKLLLPW